MDDWGATYQLVPINVHQRNIYKRAIHTFKAHFLSVLAGVYPVFPKFMWDNLLEQTKLTIKLLRQATLNPIILAWEYLNGAFDYSETPLIPIGYKKSSIPHQTSEDPGTKEDLKDLVYDLRSTTNAASKQ